ncbi:acyl-CoA dehydrogenase family protein [Bosea sp. RCC_152_1]|uniref:acyl-CoA dehydrogenase family protein n=1 Tax=Bosea sp. RCC_152_1 TaxID=3239228 RepID=UPI0035244D16
MNIAARRDTFAPDSNPVQLRSPELTALIAAIGEGASERDRTRTHPYAQIDLIRASRLGALRIPTTHGGSGASLRDLLEVVIALGAADPNVAHALRNHFGFVERFVQPALDPQHGKWLGEVVAGKIFGLAAGETTSLPVGGNPLETRLVAEGAGYRLSGTKYYSTGTLYADYVVVRAQDEGGRYASAILPVEREGITREDDWDGIGQRLTGTGTTHLDNVRVAGDEIVWDESGSAYARPYNTTLPHLIVTAVEAGIIRAIWDDAIALVRRRSRSFAHAPAASPIDDPFLQQVIGQLEAAAFAAEATILAAAEKLDRATEAAVNGRIDEGLAHDAALAAAMAKIIVDEFAIRAGSQLFDVGGASAAKRETNLDRHWRNARTLAAHNPASYKAQAIGAFSVKATPLPRTGFF